MPIVCQLDPYEQTSVKFCEKYTALIHEHSFEHVAYAMAAILSKGRWVSGVNHCVVMCFYHVLRLYVIVFVKYPPQKRIIIRQLKFMLMPIVAWLQSKANHANKHKPYLKVLHLLRGLRDIYYYIP